MKKLDDFADISPTMHWRGAAIAQIEKFKQFCDDLDLPYEVVGSHSSKSIQLPVIRIACPGFNAFLRDNFYDINICVVAQKSINLSFSALFDGIHEQKSWEWYIEEIARARSYSWREWTDEQMDDPTLLKLEPDAPSYMCKSEGEKLRWINRLSDPAWYFNDWSRSTICCDGEFGPGAELWTQGHPFMQGIENLVSEDASKPYAPNCKEFALAVGHLTQASVLIKRLIENGV